MKLLDLWNKNDTRDHMKFNLTQETPLEDFFYNLRDPTLETLQLYSRTQVSRTRVTQTPRKLEQNFVSFDQHLPQFFNEFWFM